MTATPSEPDRTSIEAYSRWVAQADDEALLLEETHALVSNPSLHAGIVHGLASEFGTAPGSIGTRVAARVNRLNARLGSFLDEIAQGLRPSEVRRGLAVLGGSATVNDQDQAVLDILEPTAKTGAVPLPSTVVDLLGSRATATWELQEGQGRLIITGVRPGFRGLVMVGLNRSDGEDEIVVADRSRPDQFTAVFAWSEAGPPPPLAILATAD